MLNDSEKIMILTTKVQIPLAFRESFIDWQAKLNATIVAFPGFVSLEILSPSETLQSASWMIIQRFSRPVWFANWRHSKDRKRLMEELKNLLGNFNVNAIQELESDISQIKGGATEVFVTQVTPDKEKAYREWIAKIHQVEAKFPGFRGVYVQSPRPGQGRNWITFLQFDQPAHLDNWLSSPERAKVLRESEFLIASLESHRIISPYSGWFGSITKEGNIPPVWKQTMLVLLVLFPLVMFELKFLPQWTSTLNASLATFIGNALSVTLIAWPMMPIAIWFLKGWLSPKINKELQINILGTLGIFLLYLIEIAIFWKFL